jgi:hypothetical protein
MAGNTTYLTEIVPNYTSDQNQIKHSGKSQPGEWLSLQDFMVFLSLSIYARIVAYIISQPLPYTFLLIHCGLVTLSFDAEQFGKLEVSLKE